MVSNSKTRILGCHLGGVLNLILCISWDVIVSANYLLTMDNIVSNIKFGILGCHVVIKCHKLWFICCVVNYYAN